MQKLVLAVEDNGEMRQITGPLPEHVAERVKDNLEARAFRVHHENSHYFTVEYEKLINLPNLTVDNPE